MGLICKLYPGLRTASSREQGSPITAGRIGAPCVHWIAVGHFGGPKSDCKFPGQDSVGRGVGHEQPTHVTVSELMLFGIGRLRWQRDDPSEEQQGGVAATFTTG